MAKVIEISEQALRAQGVRITDYVREVVECGHEPGVLSGAALKGKAKQYSSSYYFTRNRVGKAVYRITREQGNTVYEGLELIRVNSWKASRPDPRRWVRVWADDSGPVRLALTA
tara:strand:- start:883 stop:1224 length:342 start_codon:yes stop_codon:yes gene_type:complete